MRNGSTYHIAELLVKSVAGSASSFLVGYLGSNPGAQVVLVLICEMGSSKVRVITVSLDDMNTSVRCLLFASASATRIFVYKWCIHQDASLDAFLDP